MTLAELLASWGYTLKDRGSIAVIACKRCAQEFAWPMHRLGGEDVNGEAVPEPLVCWTLGVHAGEHLRPGEQSP